MKKYLFASVMGLLGIESCFAGVTITGTRIIFPSDQKQVVVQLNNPDSHAALVQAWLDDGNPKEIPAADRIPFVLTPPLSRIEENKGQMLRLIAKNTNQLAQDRESLYWFNILDVAPTDHAVPNKLNISVRSRIKLFYRPIHLKGKPENFFSKLSFKYIKDLNVIEVSNNSPYYMNFQKVVVSNNNQQQEVYTDPLMVAPFGHSTFKTKITSPKTINYLLINDFGGINSLNTTIN
ncbi:fimbrial biogenesis chaperone [Acinetobacter sp. HY1485]|uniref:fimbrial biogenesis chaperone n=1 Tax=Acinetobacter sp. HY1485 TaxID=2970918 RepID=UPI0022B97C85|nr:molecular chaperone [Acinetobacter sp. HY1485]